MKTKLAVLLCLIPTVVLSQSVTMRKKIECFPPFDIEKRMEESKYHERLLVKGIDTDNNTFVEWYENLDTGTWSLIERNENMICVLATGDKGKKL